METTIRVKTDKRTKEKAQKIAGDTGMSLSEVMNKFLEHFVIAKNPTGKKKGGTLKPSVGKELMDSLEDMKKGKNMRKFANIDEAMKWVRS